MAILGRYDQWEKHTHTCQILRERYTHDVCASLFLLMYFPVRSLSLSLSPPVRPSAEDLRIDYTPSSKKQTVGNF